MNATSHACAALALLASPALAQSDVSLTNKWSWGENIGFMNWRDAGDPDGAQGVQLYSSFLGGYVWCENVGWMNLGDGTPAKGSSYANVNGTDFGVNLNTSDGSLTGYGWGENVGWVNFSGGALAKPAQPARLDLATNRLRGYAWGENVGWINLDDGEHFVAFNCPGDFNGDGLVDTRDVIAFLNAWTSRQASADCDGNGVVDTRDVLCFLNLWAAGC
ncbi:MAG: hypothetical protein IPJ41_01440 [Phycisphaerales bacterium]|nr:hypothetical protein [Phycisphaerales bacterium]